MTGIYYADLFQINGCGCLIMGHGKTKACVSLLEDPAGMIMNDSIRLEYSDNELLGYGDATKSVLNVNIKIESKIYESEKRLL